jgi:hypothetical protein
MTEAARIKPPVWFAVAVGAAILWSLAGAYACYSQLSLTPAQLAALPAAQAEAFTAMPLTIRGAYVLATGAGLIGATLLATRRRWAGIAFVASLAGVIVQFGWVFGPYQGVAKLGPAALGFPAFIVLIGLLEIWFAHLARKRGWLN